MHIDGQAIRSFTAAELADGVNVSVRDGKLILAVKKEDAGDKHYTGAGVISKVAFQYGRD